jgi:hypothetical protein
MPKETQSRTIRLPLEVDKWLLEYLEKNSYGEGFSEKFLHMVEEMKRLDKEGVTFVNLEAIQKSIVQKRDEQRKAEWGTVNSNSEICVRFPMTFKLMSPKRKIASCDFCKLYKQSEFKACQQLRRDEQKSREKNEQKTKTQL